MYQVSACKNVYTVNVNFLLVDRPTDKEETQALWGVYRMPAQGQLRGLRPVPQRQVPPDLQAAPLREAY